MKKMIIKQNNAPLGAEIECGDLRMISTSIASQIRQAWLDNLVILIRNQTLNDEALVNFGKFFGDFQFSNPLPSPLANEGKVKANPKNEQFPQITIVSNIIENGVAQGGLGDGELVWHTDMSSFEIPPNQTILHALEVPPSQGNTGFNNMYLAYERLPESLRIKIDPLQLKHDATIDAAGYLRKQYINAPTDIRLSPGAVHPLVRTHPETGKKCLFLGRREKSYLVGMEVEESEKLLNELWVHATQPEISWFHEWRAGDLVMWDNRCVMHRREPFDPSARRMLHRVVIQGTKPYR
jgi:taurine dioxygenase